MVPRSIPTAGAIAIGDDYELFGKRGLNGTLWRGDKEIRERWDRVCCGEQVMRKKWGKNGRWEREMGFIQ